MILPLILQLHGRKLLYIIKNNHLGEARTVNELPCVEKYYKTRYDVRCLTNLAQISSTGILIDCRVCGRDYWQFLHVFKLNIPDIADDLCCAICPTCFAPIQYQYRHKRWHVFHSAWILAQICEARDITNYIIQLYLQQL